MYPRKVSFLVPAFHVTLSKLLANVRLRFCAKRGAVQLHGWMVKRPFTAFRTAFHTPFCTPSRLCVRTFHPMPRLIPMTAPNEERSLPRYSSLIGRTAPLPRVIITQEDEGRTDDRQERSIPRYEVNDFIADHSGHRQQMCGTTDA